MISGIGSGVYVHFECSRYIFNIRGLVLAFILMSLQLDGMKHVLKLRTRQQLRTNLFADLGTDFHLQDRTLVPRASLEYRVHQPLPSGTPPSYS
jgi:hypothetical protein